MKKLGGFIGIVFCLLLLGGCGQREILFKEDILHNNMDNYTYKFIGESKHFYFQTGKVYYEKSSQALLISNFKVRKNVEKKASFSVQLYFDNKLLYGAVDSRMKKDELESIVIAESGNVAKIDTQGNQIGESDAFLETKKETFKDSIKLIAKYCIDDSCEEEQFKIKYLK